MCACKRREHITEAAEADAVDETKWSSGAKLAILLDLEEHSIQCYDGVEQFGTKHQQADADMFPVVYLFRPSDSIAVLVSCV